MPDLVTARASPYDHWMYVQCFPMRREGIKLTRAQVEAVIPMVGYLHLVKCNLQGEQCLEAVFTGTTDIRIGKMLPCLRPATVFKIKGRDMAITGMEQTSTANAMGPSYPQTWWVRVLTDEPKPVDPYAAPRPPVMSNLYS